MNGNRKIVVVSTVGIVALVLTTGWSVLAGDAWPPEPWQVNTMEGVWSVVDNAAPGEFTIVVLGAEDPRTGTSSALLDTIGHDWTGNGLFADIESHTPWYGTRVRTGKDIVQGTSVIYFMKDTKPRPTVTWFAVYNETCTLTNPDTAEASGMLSLYSAVEHPGHKLGNLPNQDKNKDGLPDAGEKPILCIPRNGIAPRIGLLPPCELAPKPSPAKQQITSDQSHVHAAVEGGPAPVIAGPYLVYGDQSWAYGNTCDRPWIKPYYT